MSIATILLVVLVLMLVGALPVWQHASGWGSVRAASSAQYC